MIGVKEAVQIAKQKAAEMLEVSSSLEEIERDSYKGREVWSITLSMPSNGKSLSELLSPGLQYKRFLLDAETGELVAMKLREFASQ
jgi:hypothetical protein